MLLVLGKCFLKQDIIDKDQFNLRAIGNTSSCFSKVIPHFRSSDAISCFRYYSIGSHDVSTTLSQVTPHSVRI